MTSKLLKVKEVAEILRVSPLTVYRMIRKNELRAVRWGKSRKRSIRVLEEELEKILRRRKEDEPGRNDKEIS